MDGMKTIALHKSSNPAGAAYPGGESKIPWLYIKVTQGLHEAAQDSIITTPLAPDRLCAPVIQRTFLSHNESLTSFLDISHLNVPKLLIDGNYNQAYP